MSLFTDTLFNEVILNSKISLPPPPTPKKHKNAKHMAPNRLPKGKLFIVWGLKREGRASSPFSSSAGNVRVGSLKFFTTVPVSMNNHGNTMSIDFRVTDKFEGAGKFTNIEFTNN